MDQQVRNKLRNVVTQCRKLLEESIAQQLEGQFGIRAGKKDTVQIEDEARMTHLSDEDMHYRRDLLAHLRHLQSGGVNAGQALDQFQRETAFTWLNRIVAFKMLEARRLLRETVTRLENSNGFKMWLAEDGNEAHLAEYERGGVDGRNAAYRAFLLDQCRRLSQEVRILFDPETPAGRFLPPPRTLRGLIERLNEPDLAEAWQPGNEETIGWVYQGFNSEELEQAFLAVRVSKKKFESADIPAVTQFFTPRWIVRFLVENTLGRLWIERHPDSELGASLSYLVPRPASDNPSPRSSGLKSVKEISFLDPACGTMHFGLVAFDLFVAMYREEIKNAGRPGWPAQPPVPGEEDIPAAIIAHNIHGIDIDLRAVQLSALTLYLKAKTLNPHARLTESRLACANVHSVNGENLAQFVRQAGLGPIYRRILESLQQRLKDSEQLGSLLRLEEDIRQLIDAERKRYEREGRQLRLPGFVDQQFETEAGRREFWDVLEIQIGQALDAFAREHPGGESAQTFFAGETSKGLRLLELMTQRYDVVVTNPPYMTSRNMNPTLKKLVQGQYPRAKSDFYACFIERCTEWLREFGHVGMIAQQSFMFISSYEKLRSDLTDKTAVELVAHVGPRAFEEVTGEKVNTVAFVLRREEDAERRQRAVGTYFRLVKEPDSEAKQRRFEQAVARLRAGQSDPLVYRYRQADFDAILGSPWVYWVPVVIRNLFLHFLSLEAISPAKEGINTGDNSRFIRYWWEVGVTRGYHKSYWFPLAKGDETRRFVNPTRYVVASDFRQMELLPGSAIRNRDCFFKKGITFLSNSSSRFCAWETSTNHVFCSTGGRSLFPTDQERRSLLGILNSAMADHLLSYINPTITVKVGDVNRLPIPEHFGDTLPRLVDEAVALAKADSQDDETTWDFIAPPDWPDGIGQVDKRHVRLAEIEREIDEEVYRLYGIGDEDRQAIEAELSEGGLVADQETEQAEDAAT